MNVSLLFNPTQASTEELEQTFVGRHDLLDEIEAALRNDQSTRTARHWLFIGPRGSGKSHFTELLTRRMASRHGWRIARLPEENYQVATLGDLLEQILIRSENVGRGAFSDSDEMQLQAQVLNRLRSRQQARGTPLLVILENLSSLFERQLRSAKDQERLRQMLINDPPFILVATSTSQSEATKNVSAPFHNFFNTIVLEDLTPSDITDLVKARANWENNEYLLTNFDQVKGRVEAIYHLSGGNPRLALALYRVLQDGVTAELHQQLMELLDEVTPYYQARLNDISPQAVRVLTELAISDRVLTPAEIARYCKMPTNQVTAQIGKLLDERLVIQGGRPNARSRFYEFRDRLLRIWIQMRESVGSVKRLRFLAEFFERWYSGHMEELEQASKRTMEDFWIGLTNGDQRRCFDLLKTLSYLAEIKPGFDGSIVLQTMIGHVRDTSEADVRAHLAALQRTFNQATDLKEREALAFLLSQCYLMLKAEGKSRPYLEIAIKDGSQSEAIASRYIATLVELNDYAEAWEFGNNWLEKFPDHLYVTGPLGVAALSVGETNKGFELLKQYVEWDNCRHCIEERLQSAARILQKTNQNWTEDLKQRFWKGFLAGDTDQATKSQIDAVFKVLMSRSKARISATIFLRAAAAWHPLSKAPSWFLGTAVCALAHRSLHAQETLKFIEASAEQEESLSQFIVDHLVQIIIELRHFRKSSAEAASAYARATELIRIRVSSESLTKAFRFSAPLVARQSPELVLDLIALYSKWMKAGSISEPITPYSETLEILAAEDSEKMLQSMHAEVRDAVYLLLAPVFKTKMNDSMAKVTT